MNEAAADIGTSGAAVERDTIIDDTDIAREAAKNGDIEIDTMMTGPVNDDTEATAGKEGTEDIETTEILARVGPVEMSENGGEAQLEGVVLLKLVLMSEEGTVITEGAVPLNAPFVTDEERATIEEFERTFM